MCAEPNAGWMLGHAKGGVLASPFRLRHAAHWSHLNDFSRSAAQILEFQREDVHDAFEAFDGLAFDGQLTGQFGDAVLEGLVVCLQGFEGVGCAVLLA